MMQMFSSLRRAIQSFPIKTILTPPRLNDEWLVMAAIVSFVFMIGFLSFFASPAAIPLTTWMLSVVAGVSGCAAAGASTFFLVNAFLNFRAKRRGDTFVSVAKIREENRDTATFWQFLVSICLLVALVMAYTHHSPAFMSVMHIAGGVILTLGLAAASAFLLRKAILGYRAAETPLEKRLHVAQGVLAGVLFAGAIAVFTLQFFSPPGWVSLVVIGAGILVALAASLVAGKAESLKEDASEKLDAQHDWTAGSSKADVSAEPLLGQTREGSPRSCLGDDVAFAAAPVGTKGEETTEEAGASSQMGLDGSK